MSQHAALATVSLLVLTWGSVLGIAPRAVAADAAIHSESAGRRAAATTFPGLNTSNQRMAARLAHIRETADPSSMAYLTDRQVPRLEAALTRASNFQQQASLRFNLSNQLLLSGRTDDALGVIRDLEGLVAGAGGRLREGLEAELRIRKAIAYLRLGEQENCQIADLDNDGDQDVYTVMGGAFPGDTYRNALFMNPGSTNRWLKLKLRGTVGNRAAIGARIQVNLDTPTGPRRLFKTVNSGASFGSNPLRQELGLGNAQAVKSVEVEWPGGGIRQTFNGLEMDRAYELEEGNPVPKALELKPLRLEVTGRQLHNHIGPAGQ
ncbi:MAG: ASPIC/UnbV domain-containing protein [Verrucomicrobiae bacterium]|nr:ASPIC/UnbV domain-containing protein [Verrucomicrobiae bacterium]